MWKSKQIDIGTASLVELKAELLKKKQDFERSKTLGTTSSKKSIKANDGVAERASKDLSWLKTSDAQKGGGSWKASKAALERKAQIYDRLQRGDYSEKESRLVKSGELLIDFEKKQFDNRNKKRRHSSDEEHSESEKEMMTITDEFGRTRTIPKSQAREFVGLEYNLDEDLKEYDEVDKRGFHMVPMVSQLKSKSELQKREQEADQEFEEAIMRAEKRNRERYDADKELRELGAGFYKFSQDETVRQKQMDELKASHDTTRQNQRTADQIKEERRLRTESRMEKIRLKRQMIEGEKVKNEKISQEAENFLNSVFQD